MMQAIAQIAKVATIGILGQNTAQSWAAQVQQQLQETARMLPIARPKLGLWGGVYAWHRGDHARAHQQWQRALTAAEKLDLPQDIGLIHYEIARHLPATDPQK